MALQPVLELRAARSELLAALQGRSPADLLVPGETATVSAPQIDNSRLVAASFTISKPTAYSMPGAKATGTSR